MYGSIHSLVAVLISEKIATAANAYISAKKEADDYVQEQERQHYPKKIYYLF